MIGELRFVHARGWGFIQPQQPAQRDIYFHNSGLVGLVPSDLVEGMLLQFELSQRNGKPIAVNVRRVEQS